MHKPSLDGYLVSKIWSCIGRRGARYKEKRNRRSAADEGRISIFGRALVFCASSSAGPKDPRYSEDSIVCIRKRTEHQTLFIFFSTIHTYKRAPLDK